MSNANANRFLDELPAYEKQSLESKVTDAPAQTLDLVDLMLSFDPKKRLPIQDCVAHPCFDDYREDDLELRAGYHVEMDDVETVKLEKKAIQKLLYDDIRAFHRAEPADISHARAISWEPEEDALKTRITIPDMR